MNKNNKQGGFSGIAAIGIVAAVVVVVIMFGYSVNSKQSQKNDAMMAEDKMVMEKKAMEEKEVMMKGENTKADSMMKKDDTSTMDKGDTTMKAGSYEVYASEKVMLASATNNVVLFFRASWCPTCIGLDNDIKANLGKIPSGLTILDVNYDNSSDLKKKYGVTYQHTFVQVDKDGNLIKKWSGSPSLTALVAEIK